MFEQERNKAAKCSLLVAAWDGHKRGDKRMRRRLRKCLKLGARLERHFDKWIGLQRGHETERQR